MRGGSPLTEKFRRILLPGLVIVCTVFWGYPYLYRMLVLEGGYLQVSEEFGVVYGTLALAISGGLVLYRKLRLLKKGRKNYHESLAVFVGAAIWLGSWNMVRYAEASWSVPVQFKTLGEALQEPVPKNLVVPDIRIDFDGTRSLRTNSRKAKGGTIYAAYYVAPLIVEQNANTHESFSGQRPWICVRYEKTMHATLSSPDAKIEDFYRAADFSFATGAAQDIRFFERLTERDNMYDEFDGLVEGSRDGAKGGDLLLYAVSEPFDERADRFFTYGLLLFFLALGLVVIPVLCWPLRSREEQSTVVDDDVRSS